MGTRGTYGMRKSETDKLMYNHFDSYPSALGVTMMNFVKGKTDAELSDQYDFMQEVDSDTPPTKEQWEKCHKAGTINLGVSSQKEDDWYCVLRNLQGDLSKQCPPSGVPYFVKNNDFVKDSLSCEWGYIVNVDTGKLEIYKGFNKNKNGRGRYARMFDKEDAARRKEHREKPYYGIVLVAEVPFADIRKWSETDIEKAATGFEVTGCGESDKDEKGREAEEFIKGYLA